MEVLEQQHDLEQVRALLGHARIDTTQIYTSIRPSQLKRAVGFYEENAAREMTARSMFEDIAMFLKPGSQNANEITLVTPTGVEPHV
jgi:hypothetical protein